MDKFIESTAIFSEDKQYRYVLTRRWEEGDKSILWIMLNPSKADQYKLDPTLTRCLRFSQKFGYNKMIVCNLFALRSTNPKALYTHEEPIGSENLNYILHEAQEASKIVLGWGNHSGRDEDWKNMLLQGIKGIGKEIYCLGINKNSKAPRHPLYMRSDSKLQQFLLK